MSRQGRECEAALAAQRAALSDVASATNLLQSVARRGYLTDAERAEMERLAALDREREEAADAPDSAAVEAG